MKGDGGDRSEKRRALDAAALALAAALLACPTAADDVIAIRDARVVSVSGPVLERATVVVRDGRIADVGATAQVPAGARVIDARGLTVYPGLVDADSALGLTEVPGVPASDDFSELGEFNPQLSAFDAFHVDSAFVAIARLAGVTAAASSPSGGMLPGQAALMSLAGATADEMQIERRAALLLDYPKLLELDAPAFQRRRRPFLDSRPALPRLEELKQFLAAARRYAEARSGGAARAPDIDPRFEALRPVLEGRQTVLIPVDSEIDIRGAVQFAEAEALARYALLGAADAFKVGRFLADHKVPVILRSPDRLPVREDDPIDIVCRTPAILHEAGVRFAIATRSGSADARGLRHDAGLAAGCGLPPDVALRSVTLEPARILGAADQIGSIETGKRANLVVYDGDILEYGTHLRHLLVDGREVPLRSRHTDLYERYKDR